MSRGPEGREDLGGEERLAAIRSFLDAPDLPHLRDRIAQWVTGRFGVRCAALVVARKSSEPSESHSAQSGAGVDDPEMEMWLHQDPDRTAALEQGRCVTRWDAPAGARRSDATGCLLLAPVLDASGLQGVLQVELSRDQPMIPNQGLETLLAVCREVAPLVARLRELEVLRARRIPVAPADLSELVHDLRSPLLAVFGYAKMILRGQAGEVTSLQRQYLTTVLENANRMLGCLNTLSLKGGAEAVADRFDLRCLCEESVDLVRPLALRKNVRLVDRYPDAPLEVSGSRDKLALALYELLSTAVKSGAPGARIEVNVEASPGFATTRISDPAGDVSPVLLTRLAGSPRPLQPAVEAQGGTSTVRDILRMHHGQIEVRSQPGQGWTLILTLPASPPAEAKTVFQTSHDQPYSVSSG